MKKEQKILIRDWAWRMAWKEFKNKYTMAELADAFDTSLPTFFRVMKAGNKKVGKNNK